jgi:hypothetical protein
MADGTSDLVITVGGDLSALETAFDQIPQIAQQAFAQVETAIQAVDWSGVTQGAAAASAAIDGVSESASSTQTDLTAIGTALSATDDSFTQAASSAADLGTSWDDLSAAGDAVDSANASVAGSMEDLGSAAEDAASSVQQLQPALEEDGDAAEEAEGGFAGMAEQLVAFGEALAVTEGLKEFGEEALTTYGNVEKATISLTALTGSAETANETIESLKTLAESDALQFPALVAAAQKMTALGFSTEQMNTVLQTAADTAAATGNDFSTVANSIDRMALSGTVAARQLATLGLSTTALGASMGVAAGEVTTAFKALDQGDRLDAITDALSKFGGVAGQVAQGISGQWQNLKTQFEFVLEGIGAALAPVISQLLSFASSTIVPTIQAMVNWFNQLPAPIKDAAVAIGLIVAAAAPLAVAVGGFGLAISGISAAIPALEAVGAAFTVLATESIPAAAAAIGNAALAVSEGLTGALTAGETALLGFAAAGTAVAAAFVFYDQIKQLVSNLTDLNNVLSVGVPAWNDFKAAVSSVADTIGGAVVGAFNALTGVLGPVGDALKSIGSYLPSFTSLWNDVSNAISSIHWSDLIGPIGALNSALKALAQGIQLVTGVYPSMATAGTAALNSIQTANDKLNDSLAKQAGGFTALAPVQAAYTAAHQASAAAVTAHAAAAAALAPAVTNVGTAAAFVGPTVQMLAQAHTAAAAAAASQATATGTLGGTLSTVAGTQVWTAATAITDLVVCMDDASAATTDFTGKITDLGGLITDAVPDVNDLQAALDGVSDAEADVADNSAAAVAGINSIASAASSASSAVDSLSDELDQAMNNAIGGKGGKGGKGGLQITLKPGETFSVPNADTYISEGSLGDSSGLGFGNPLPGQTPYNTTQEIYGGVPLTGAGKFADAVAAATTAVTALTTATTTGTAAAVTNYNALGQVTNAATAGLNALTTASTAATAATTAATVATTAVTAATAPLAGVLLDTVGDPDIWANLTTGFQDSSTALGDIPPAANANTSALGLSSTALNALNGVVAGTTSSVATLATATAAAAAGAMAASDALSSIGEASQPFVAALTGIGHILGVGGTGSVPSIGSASTSLVVPSGGSVNGGVGNGTTDIQPLSGSPMTLQVNVGTVIGSNLQQAANQMGQLIIGQLGRQGIRINRQ